MNNVQPARRPDWRARLLFALVVLISLAVLGLTSLLFVSSAADRGAARFDATPPPCHFGPKGPEFRLKASLPGEDVTREADALARVSRGEMVRAFIESLEYRRRFGGQ